jgi:predicted nucleotidyltransferase
MFYEEIFRELNKKKVDYVVVGGVAVVMHGVVRLTADLDLMVHLEERNLAKFVEVMNELGYRPKVPVKAESFIDPENRRLWIEEKNMRVFSFYHPKKGIMLIDIFIDEPVSYNKIKEDSVRMKMGNLLIPTVSVEDLIRLKEISGRPQDIADIEALKRLDK